MRNKLSQFRQKRIIKFFSEYSELASYWAGFLLADGCLRNDRLTLVIIDREHLTQYCRDLGIPKSLVRKKSSPIKFTHHQQWQVQITIPRLSSILKDWGIVPNKSYHFHRPEIPVYLFPSFLRGLMDGDGHRRPSGEWRLVGNKHLLNWVARCLRRHKISVRHRNYSDDRPYKRLAIIDPKLHGLVFGFPHLKRKWP